MPLIAALTWVLQYDPVYPSSEECFRTTFGFGVWDALPDHVVTALGHLVPAEKPAWRDCPIKVRGRVLPTAIYIESGPLLTHCVPELSIVPKWI